MRPLTFLAARATIDAERTEEPNAKLWVIAELIETAEMIDWYIVVNHPPEVWLPLMSKMEDSTLALAGAYWGLVWLIKLIYERYSAPVHVFRTCLCRAAEQGRVNVLQWLKKKGVEAGGHELQVAIERNRLEVVQWLATSDTFSLRRAMNFACKCGSFECARYFCDQGACLTKRNAMDLIIHGDVKCLSWVFQISRGMGWENMQWMATAAEGGNVENMEWLRARGIPPNETAMTIAVDCCFWDAVKWLHSHEIKVPPDIFIMATSNDVEIIKWALSLGIVPPPESLKYAVVEGDLDAVKVLHAAGVVMSAALRQEAGESNYYKCIKWLQEQGVALRPCDTCLTFENALDSECMWCLKNFYADEVSHEDVPEPWQNYSGETVKWLVSRIFPD